MLEFLAVLVMAFSALDRFEVNLSLCHLLYVCVIYHRYFVIVISMSSTVLTCDISSTVNQSTLTETAVDGPVVMYIDNAKLVSADLFSFDDEPVIVDVSPRVSICR